MTVIEILRSTH